MIWRPLAWGEMLFTLLPLGEGTGMRACERRFMILSDVAGE
ncbi:MAG: hypothetical protein QOK48_524 [Blastocatellia bacterium]|jgi:hypothetical protein|nr:hypothetical protein [Blastocatellia bacterium]